MMAKGLPSAGFGAISEGAHVLPPRLSCDAQYQDKCLERSQDPGCFIAHIDAKMITSKHTPVATGVG